MFCIGQSILSSQGGQQGGNQQGGSGSNLEQTLEKQGIQAAEGFAKSKGW